MEEIRSKYIFKLIFIFGYKKSLKRYYIIKILLKILIKIYWIKNGNTSCDKFINFIKKKVIYYHIYYNRNKKEIIKNNKNIIE